VQGSEEHGNGQPDCADEAGRRGQHCQRGKPADWLSLRDFACVRGRRIAVPLHASI